VAASAILAAVPARAWRHNGTVCFHGARRSINATEPVRCCVAERSVGAAAAAKRARSQCALHVRSATFVQSLLYYLMQAMEAVLANEQRAQITRQQKPPCAFAAAGAETQATDSVQGHNKQKVPTCFNKLEAARKNGRLFRAAAALSPYNCQPPMTPSIN
jgi:hypothetical protein